MRSFHFNKSLISRHKSLPTYFLFVYRFEILRSNFVKTFFLLRRPISNQSNQLPENVGSIGICWIIQSEMA